MTPLGAVVRGSLLLWPSHAVAIRYAEARYVLYGKRQQVRKLGELWHVARAKENQCG